MKLITKQTKQTYINKNGDEKPYTNYFLVADNGKVIQIKCAFKNDYPKLNLLADNDLNLVVLKRQSEKTFTNKSGNTSHYYNYFLSTSEDKFGLQIQCCFDDYDRLDMVSVYVGQTK